MLPLYNVSQQTHWTLRDPAGAVGLFTGLHFEQLFYLYLAILLILGVYLTYSGFRSTQR
jgi:hypothetical protein